jgi:hypothetical protein
MENMTVDVHIADGVSPIQLHDLWLQLFRRRSEMVKVSGALWRQWKVAEASGGSARADRLWKQYVAFQSDYRVLCAWTDLLHTAWVFSTEGRQCPLVGDLAVTQRVAALTS